MRRVLRGNRPCVRLETGPSTVAVQRGGPWHTERGWSRRTLLVTVFSLLTATAGCASKGGSTPPPPRRSASCTATVVHYLPSPDVEPDLAQLPWVPRRPEPAGSSATSFTTTTTRTTPESSHLRRRAESRRPISMKILCRPNAAAEYCCTCRATGSTALAHSPRSSALPPRTPGNSPPSWPCPRRDAGGSPAVTTHDSCLKRGESRTSAEFPIDHGPAVRGWRTKRNDYSRRRVSEDGFGGATRGSLSRRRDRGRDVALHQCLSDGAGLSVDACTS